MAGGPLTLEVFLSGFLKGKNGLFEHLWAEQIKQQQYIFHSKIITGDIKVRPSQVSTQLWFPMPGVQPAFTVSYGGSRTGGIVL